MPSAKIDSYHKPQRRFSSVEEKGDTEERLQRRHLLSITTRDEALSATANFTNLRSNFLGGYDK